MSRELLQNNSKPFLFIIFVSLLPVVLQLPILILKNLTNSEENEESKIYYDFSAQR